MPQTLVVTVAEAKSRMAIPSDQLGANTAVESAIGSAQLRAESELDSSIDLKTYEDTFHLDPEYFADVTPGGLLRLQLRSGLVRRDIKVKAFLGRTWDTCTDPLDLAGVKVDYDRGIIYMDRSRNQGLYCRVQYSAGFEDGDEIPEWLREAVLAYIPVVWNFAHPTNRSEEAEKQARLSGDHAMSILSRYQRNIGFTYRPVY